MNKIFILHGWTYSNVNIDPLKKWDLFIKFMASKGTNPVLLRIPGLTTAIDQVWNLEEYVKWLKKITDDEKGKVILIGHSNGGRIAFSFAEKYPDKISQLVLIDSAGVYHNELPIRIKRFIFGNMAKLGKKITTSETLKILLYKLAREGDYGNALPAQRRTMLNLISTDLTGILSKIQVPTLIIWGQEDTTTPLEDGKLMHSLVKGSKLYVVKGAGHSPQFTHTKEVADLIIKELPVV
ncbi:alpha/beta hydrolase [Candidatus Daviesbacteria bacterium]|nr:alpha/beta hydrolase [Candidatus Daviesbacteria bacterium]